MTDNISFVESDLIKEKIQIIMRQTDYNNDIAREKLIENNFDEIATIKSYLGIKEKKNSHIIKSLNQEIYKQIRYKLDSNMRDYKNRVEKGEVKKIV
jgi:hypothetical protein